MSRVFKGQADGLKYYETDTDDKKNDYRAVYHSKSKIENLKFPGKPDEIIVVRSYIWSGIDWRPYEPTLKQKKTWQKDILLILGSNNDE